MDDAEPLLRYFQFEHLSSDWLKSVSAGFADQAYRICALLPRTPERTVALRKLLEAKDAAVRAAVDHGIDPRG